METLQTLVPKVSISSEQVQCQVCDTLQYIYSIIYLYNMVINSVTIGKLSTTQQTWRVEWHQSGSFLLTNKERFAGVTDFHTIFYILYIYI